MTGGDKPHLDVEATLSQLWEMAHRADRRRPEDSAFDQKKVDAYEKKVARAQRWGGWVWGLVGIVSAFFTAGVTYAVFMGANATDAEVEKALHDQMKAHNGGTHPATIDPKTHSRVGDHPDIREQLENANTELQQLHNQADRMEGTQKVLDKRSEYGYELGRWQAETMEAERQRKPRPKKPERLKQLESELMMNKYD